MTTISPTDVNYLTNRIQSNAVLTGNTEACEVGTNTGLPSDSERHPVTRSTGNSIVYLVGEATITGAIALDEVVLTLPLDRPILSKSFLIASIVDAGVRTPVIFQIDGRDVTATAAIASGNTLYFDGIVYITG